MAYAPSPQSGIGPSEGERRRRMARRGRLEDFLPENWTHADQEIIECLLLAPPTPVPAHKRVSPLTIPTEEVAPGETVTYEGELTPASIGSSMMTPTSDAELTQSSETTEFDRDDHQQSPGDQRNNTSSDERPKQGGSSSPPTGKRTRRTQRRKRVAPEERKIKHREVQRRFMQRKKASIAQTKLLAAELEQKMQILRLTTEQQHLEHENSALQEHTSRVEMSEHQRNLRLDALLEAENAVIQQFYLPMSYNAWIDLMAHSVRHIDALSSDPSFQSTDLRVMGWSDRRKIEGSTFQFTLSKTFPHMCAQDLMNGLWSTVSTENSYKAFFSPALRIKMHVLQRIGLDAVVVNRAIFLPTTGRISRSLEVISRIRRASEFIYIVRSLNGLELQQRVGDPMSWSNTLTYLRFIPTDPSTPTRGCTVQFGGSYHNMPVTGATYWLMEVLFMVLRFESTMIAPMFTLGQE